MSFWNLEPQIVAAKTDEATHAKTTDKPTSGQNKISDTDLRIAAPVHPVHLKTLGAIRHPNER